VHFDGAMVAWLEFGKSGYGIKDSKDFTDLLIRRLALQDTTPPIANVTIQESVLGSILRIIWKEDDHWFGFISRGNYNDNVYFDKWAYTGDLSRLVPGTKVEYEIESGTRAKHVYVA